MEFRRNTATSLALIIEKTGCHAIYKKNAGKNNNYEETNPLLESITFFISLH